MWRKGCVFPTEDPRQISHDPGHSRTPGGTRPLDGRLGDPYVSDPRPECPRRPQTVPVRPTSFRRHLSSRPSSASETTSKDVIGAQAVPPSVVHLHTTLLQRFRQVEPGVEHLTFQLRPYPLLRVVQPLYRKHLPPVGERPVLGGPRQVVRTHDRTEGVAVGPEVLDVLSSSPCALVSDTERGQDTGDGRGPGSAGEWR